MDGHAGDGEHTLVAGRAAEMLLALVREEGLLGLESAVAVVAEDARGGIGGRALLLAAHCSGKDSGASVSGRSAGGGEVATRC